MPLTKGFFAESCLQNTLVKREALWQSLTSLFFLLVQSGRMQPGPCQKGRFLATNRPNNTSRVKNAADLFSLGVVVKRML